MQTECTQLSEDQTAVGPSRLTLAGLIRPLVLQQAGIDTRL